MSDNLPVAWLARHGETAWSLTDQHTDRSGTQTFAQVFTAPL